MNSDINPWGGLIKQEHMSTFTGCPYGDGEHFFIGVTGNVIPCCIDLEEEIIFGNIMKDPKSEILERRNEFYQSLKEGPTRSLCKRCLNL